MPPEVVGALLLVVWVTLLLGWAFILRWERTHQTEARRRELEAERAARTTRGPQPLGQRAWAFGARATVVLLPALFVADALLFHLGLLYSPWLTYGGPFALPLQGVGVALTLLALAIMLGVGRILAVHVYRKATHEREMLHAGIYAHVRHPFYLHFFLLPIGLVLLTLNALTLAILVAYLTMWGPTLPTTWMRQEEKELLQRYGQAYADYMARTGQLLPRLRRGG